MRLEQLNYLIKIVDMKSFNKAAKALYISQPALTASIQALEQELGVQLLHRTKQGTYPTDYGMKIYMDCKELIGQLEQKMTDWKMMIHQEEALSGTVRLAAIPVACNFAIENLIYDMKNAYPKIRISLHEVQMDHMLSDMLRGNYNLCLTSINDVDLVAEKQHLYSYGFLCEPLIEDQYRVVMSVSNPLAQKETITLDDFYSQTALTYSYTVNNGTLLNSFYDYHFKNDKLELLNSLGSIIQAIAENQGVTILLNRFLNNNWFVRNNIICTRPIDGHDINPNHHCLIYQENLSATEKAVADFILENYTTYYQ